MTKRSDNAAKLFYGGLRPDRSFNNTDDPVKPLVRAAFGLYEAAWKGTEGFTVMGWTYPFNVLAGRDQIGGDEPWIVLLLRAIEIARPELLPAEDSARVLIREAAELIRTSTNLGGTGKSLAELRDESGLTLVQRLRAKASEMVDRRDATSDDSRANTAKRARFDGRAYAYRNSADMVEAAGKPATDDKGVEHV